MPGPNGRKVVLLAEDDTDQAFLARKMMERQGYVVVTAQDGEQALSLADAIHPSAMVLDLVMPGIDGFEVLKAMKDWPGGKPPILAVSSMRGYLPKAREMGADDALRKPYSSKLIERLAILMNGKETRLPAPLEVSEEPPRGDKRMEEERRHAAVQSILALLDGAEAGADQLLQELTERAARLFDVRACLISLVTRDQDIWVAGSGLPGTPGRAVPRETSICSHSIATRAAIVVHDAEENPFFRDSEARRMGIRFYAGVPLTNRTGESLGSFCLIDHRPRDFSWIELELLGRLADAVVGSFEWKERGAHPHEPVSSFRHLDMVDPELFILGRDGFNVVLRALSDRAAEYPDDPDTRVSVVAVETDESRLSEVVDKLRENFPVAMLGRLGVRRAGVAVVGTDPKMAESLATQAVGEVGRVSVLDASFGSFAAMDALRLLEARLDSPPEPEAPTGEGELRA